MAEREQGHRHSWENRAHGIVFPLHRLTPITRHFDEPPAENKSWALIPPLHTFRRHDDEGLPTYVYTSPALNAVWETLIILDQHVDEFRQGFLPLGQRKAPRELLPLP